MSNADVGPRRRADGRRRKQWGASTGIVASGSGEVLRKKRVGGVNEECIPVVKDTLALPCAALLALRLSVARYARPATHAPRLAGPAGGAPGSVPHLPVFIRYLGFS